MLNQRVRTALLLAPLPIICVLIGGLILKLLVLAIVSVAVFEYFGFACSFNTNRRLQCSLCALMPSFGFLFFGIDGLLGGLTIGTCFLFMLLLTFIESDTHLLDFESVVPNALLGLIYPGLLGSILLLAVDTVSSSYVLWFLSIIIACDTFAYFGGSLIGGLAFSPRISPKKTVAGILVGVICAAAVSLLVADALSISSEYPLSLLFGVVIAITGAFGDLAESLLKRVHNVKDSGSILPGHGGILDRIDAMLFASPLLIVAQQFFEVA